MQNYSASACRLTSRRRGVLSMEVMLSLPILAILLTGVWELSLMVVAEGAVIEASRQGARRAGLQGVTDAEVDQQVRRALGGRLAAAADVRVMGAAAAGDPVAVAVAVPLSVACPDLLWPVGLGLEGRTLTSETRMIKE